MELHVSTQKYNLLIIKELTKIFGSYTDIFVNILTKNKNHSISGDLIFNIFFEKQDVCNSMTIYICNCNPTKKSEILKIENFLLNFSIDVTQNSTLNTISCLRHTSYILKDFTVNCVLIKESNFQKYFNTVFISDVFGIYFTGYVLFYKKKFLKKNITINIDYITDKNIMDCLDKFKQFKDSGFIIDNIKSINKKLNTLVLSINNSIYSKNIELDINSLFSNNLEIVDSILKFLFYEV